MRFTMILLVLFGLAGCSEQAGDETGETPVVSEQDRRARNGDAESKAKTGKAIFDHWCLPCHDAGPGHPGTMALSARYGEERAVILEREELTAEYVKHVVRNGFNMMPPMKPTEITDAELERLANYVASAPEEN